MASRTYGTIICPGCGKRMVKTSPNTKRCKPCALEAHGQTGDGYRERVCQECGASYKPTGTHQKACASCVPLVRAKYNREHLTALRRNAGERVVGAVYPCIQCGADYVYHSGPETRCPRCSAAKKAEALRVATERTPKERAERYRRTAKDNYSFGGNRQKALERDGFACQHCGTTKDLAVHHRDGSGTGRGGNRHARNDALDNLQTLCRRCHTTVHQEIIRVARSTPTP